MNTTTGKEAAMTETPLDLMALLVGPVALNYRPTRELASGGTLPGGWTGNLDGVIRYGSTWNAVLTSFADSIGASMHSMAAALGRDIRYRARVEALREAIATGRISHSRARVSIGGYRIDVYRREPTSPTGVLHFDSFAETDAEAMALLRGGLSPLSPTEAR